MTAKQKRRFDSAFQLFQKYAAQVMNARNEGELTTAVAKAAGARELLEALGATPERVEELAQEVLSAVETRRATEKPKEPKARKKKAG